MYKKDYTIIIKADANDEVYWEMLRRGEPAACKRRRETGRGNDRRSNAQT